MTKAEYHKKFDEMYGNHKPNLSLSKAELAASNAAYGWQADENGKLSLEMFPKPFKRGFLKGYEQAEKDLVLTWEDIRTIHELSEDVWEPNCNEQECYTEVLKRYLEEKK